MSGPQSSTLAVLRRVSSCRGLRASLATVLAPFGGSMQCGSPDHTLPLSSVQLSSENVEVAYQTWNINTVNFHDDALCVTLALYLI